ncbi:hypothetical protein [Variovorax ginsengisoli]|uniref:Uncharacterized protein n=1 Tax=Variovorax ginsengisoli TaxID=363844 RepID=A0ABT8SF96_9BURK|nr:hypothetical protein [Variovorax ginsengisoli]MDN8618285.1 hypothetical protein [Variovorax ginsengisoli]MDO1537455.1 hypothetical protein [Variovorax ginsengisoli]
MDALRESIDALADMHPQFARYYCYDEALPSHVGHAIGRLDVELLARWMPPASCGGLDVDAYFLGPKSFSSVRRRACMDAATPRLSLHDDCTMISWP